MNRSITISSNQGDQYRLSLSDDDGLNLSKEIADKYGLRIINIELVRVKGKGIASSMTLHWIEQLTAETFWDYPDSLLMYYCDFLNPIPATKKRMFPQEYRSRLFSLMFQRYVKHHDVVGVSEIVVRIEGVDEPYFIHFITRDEHVQLVYSIAAELKEAFEK